MGFRFPTGLNSAQLATVSFEDGLDSNDNLVSVNYWNWTYNSDPPTYAAPATGTAHKWEAAGQAAVAGTSGGTITYYFDPASNWTASQEQAFISSLTLWSDYANVTFQQVTSASQAQVILYQYGTTTGPTGHGVAAGTYETSTYTDGTVGTGSIGVVTATSADPAYIVVDTQTPYTSQLGSFSTYGGSGVSSLVHEEGELLGLGHTGPYSTSPPSNQLNQYDTSLYSIESFYQPNNTAAPYYSSYAVTGTNWGTTADGYANGPTTPQMMDILAIQQLYGVSTSTTFAGGQIFGFNCNITDASEPFFDFTINTQPVITLWDSGTDNTLDLAGFTNNSTVDLNPGTFSSVAGLVNNIGIAYGTAIDTAIGGSGNDIFMVNSDADAINGGGGTNTVDLPLSFAAYQVGVGAGLVTVDNPSTGIDDTFTNIQFLQFADQTVAVAELACFAQGTRITTDAGDVAVERLEVGDRVVTISGGTRKIVWLGRRRVDCRRHPRPSQVQPICVQAHAFGPGMPARDLLLSPDHAVFVAGPREGALVPVRCLVNDLTITRLQIDTITYFHVELERHDILLAEGLPAESFLDTGNRGAFSNGGGVVQMAPDFALMAWESTGCAPLMVSGPIVEVERERLRARAAGAQRSVNRNSMRRFFA